MKTAESLLAQLGVSPAETWRLAIVTESTTRSSALLHELAELGWRTLRSSLTATNGNVVVHLVTQPGQIRGRQLVAWVFDDGAPRTPEMVLALRTATGADSAPMPRPEGYA